jgi:hypothetical protein
MDLQRCSGCRLEKPHSEFASSCISNGFGYCRPCKRIRQKDWKKRNVALCTAQRLRNRAKNLERDREANRRHWNADAERSRGYNLKRYKITVEQYRSMEAQQKGLCACCGNPPLCGRKVLYVDHCHSSGKIRGLLCHKCNCGIGALGDTIQGVERALDYLKRSERT